VLLYNTLNPAHDMIPQSYDQWRRCIEVDCGIPLTPDFIRARLAELVEPSDFRTVQFVRLYGEAHRQRVITWFQQALPSP